MKAQAGHPYRWMSGPNDNEKTYDSDNHSNVCYGRRRAVGAKRQVWFGGGSKAGGGNEYAGPADPRFACCNARLGGGRPCRGAAGGYTTPT
jgi:hypothetical protein